MPSLENLDTKKNINRCLYCGFSKEKLEESIKKAKEEVKQEVMKELERFCCPNCQVRGFIDNRITTNKKIPPTAQTLG